MAKHKKKTFQGLVLSHIETNLKEYLIVVFTLLIGIVLGVIVFNNASDDVKLEIQAYINNFISDLRESKEIDKFSLFKSCFINNLILIISLVFIGSTVIGFPIIYGIIAYKGFCFSYSISAIVATLGTWKGLFFCVLALFLQNLIYIPCILALAVSGIKLYKSILKDKRKENIKIEIIRHLFFSCIIGIVFLLGTLVEAYVSTSLVISLSNFLL